MIICVLILFQVIKERESERRNVQLCKQQVDSSKPHRVLYLCGQEPHWTIALFPRRPQSEASTLCWHDTMESAGTTLSSILISMTTYYYRVYVSCTHVFSKYGNTRAERGKKVWNVECFVIETHSYYSIVQSVSPVSQNRIQQVRNEPRRQGRLRAHNCTYVDTRRIYLHMNAFLQAHPHYYYTADDLSQKDLLRHMPLMRSPGLVVLV